MTAIRESEKELETCFQEIGSIVMGALPEDWFKVVIGYFIENESEVAYQQLFFFSQKSRDYVDVLKEAWNNDIYAEAASDIKKVCKDIHDSCAKAHDKWSSMTMSIERNGSFDTHFSYEPISKFDSAYALDWQSEYLD